MIGDISAQAAPADRSTGTIIPCGQAPPDAACPGISGKQPRGRTWRVAMTRIIMINEWFTSARARPSCRSISRSSWSGAVTWPVCSRIRLPRVRWTGELDLNHSTTPHRRTSDLPAGDVVRRGYQGVDFLTCRLRLEEWADSDADRLKACIHDMDTHDGYDDLLIDSSGMEPAAILGCCLAAAVVVLVVTPDARSQAEAFALLRILRLNGFDGALHLLVNRLHDAQQAADTRGSAQRPGQGASWPGDAAAWRDGRGRTCRRRAAHAPGIQLGLSGLRRGDCRGRHCRCPRCHRRRRSARSDKP